ncbi:MAG TPA: hypothetical protein DCW68_06950 [Rhodospirillaceae bacterium]|nr:hypothetical protein [Rhodospirillaceae bacterium]
MSVMQTYSEIINKWPSIADFAVDVDVYVGLAAVWKHRNSIPPRYWQAIVSAASARGIEGVSIELFATIAASKREAA